MGVSGMQCRNKAPPPRDTIALLQLTSWKKRRTVRLNCAGGDDKIIDLKLFLDIYFEVYNNSGKRYQLLTYNCHFFARTIITIVARKTVIFEAKLNDLLNMALNHSMAWVLFEGAGDELLVGSRHGS